MFYKNLLIHSSPLVLGVIASYLFWRLNSFLLFFYILLVAAIIVLGKDKRTEVMIVVYGIAVGFIIEAIGTSISGYQSFTNPDIWGIPYWLPVSWGYGFLLMKRVSLIIATGSPWMRTTI